MRVVGSGGREFDILIALATPFSNIDYHLPHPLFCEIVEIMGAPLAREAHARPWLGGDPRTLGWRPLV